MSRLLLVESEMLLGRLVGTYLMDAGHEVSKVLTPEEVADRLVEEGFDPDAIIFNTRLPVEQKSEFMYRWRELAAAVRIIEISEEPLIRAGPATDLATMGYPDCYVQIPFDWRELPDIVADCLRDPSADQP